jgi:hypothetical protein
MSAKLHEMSEWKPRVRDGLRWEVLNLTAEEGFVLSRLDGATSVEALRHLTGMSGPQVSQVLQKLVAHGAVEPVVDVAKTALLDMHQVVEHTLEESPSAPKHHQAGRQVHDIDDDDDDDDDAIIAAAMAALKLDPSLEGDATDEGDPVEDVDDPAVVQVPTAVRAQKEARHIEVGEDDAAGDEGDHDDGDAGDQDDDAAGGDDGDAGDQGDKDDADAQAKADEDDAVEEGNYRKLFETKLHPLPQEEREKLARHGSGAELLALCFDPVPAVVMGLFENSEVGFSHARLLARYHRTSQGLDGIFKRTELGRDTQVQRWLLANPMLSDAQFKRVLQPKPLAQIYKWALSRDLPERNRQKVRLMLRSKWGVADGEERANLIWSTEGRCLQYLIGQQIDSKATTLLCARSIHSVMLIQSLARFTATPPPLLNHLARQPVVKRQPNLRAMILQHPNCPSELKRKKA